MEEPLLVRLARARRNHLLRRRAVVPDREQPSPSRLDHPGDPRVVTGPDGTDN